MGLAFKAGHYCRVFPEFRQLDCFHCMYETCHSCNKHVPKYWMAYCSACVIADPSRLDISRVMARKVKRSEGTPTG
jgi:hypothetical protein